MFGRVRDPGSLGRSVDSGRRFSLGIRGARVYSASSLAEMVSAAQGRRRAMTAHGCRPHRSRSSWGPPGTPQADLDQLKTLFTFWQDYGPYAYRIWLSNQLFIIITDPNDNEPILTKQPPMRKAALYDLLDEWLGEGLLTRNGIKWYKHRCIFQFLWISLIQ